MAGRLTWTGRRVEREAGRRPLLGRYTNLGWVLNGYSGSDFVELTKQ